MEHAMRNGKPRVYRRALLAAACGGCWCVAGPGLAGTDFMPDEAGLSAGVRGAAIAGFAQTPTGGRPGTSDVRRPDFDELGLRDAWLHDAGLQGRWGNVSVYGSIQIIRLAASGVLAESLVTRTERYEPGDAFRCRLQYNVYRIGFGRPFEAASRVRIEPRIEYALMAFGYRFEAAGRAIESRYYRKGTLRLGFDSRLQWDERMALTLAAGGSVPLSNTPRIAEGELRFHYTLTRPEAEWKAGLYTGVGVLSILYRDNQEFPNHVHFRTRPHGSAGMWVGF